MRIVRILIYEGDEAWIMRTLEKSLRPGLFKPAARGEITVIEVPIKENTEDPERGYADHFLMMEKEIGDVR